MNPAQAEQALKEKIIRYLDRTLPVKGNMPEDMRKKFETFQTEKGTAGMDFVRPPYLEVTQTYKTSSFSLQNLVERGELEQDVADAFAAYFGGSTTAIHPYEHQYQSLLAVDGEAKQNLVVCTGTGSGKTECFLLPLINAIYRQHKQAQEAGVPYKEHIRAMILYPMNALVNDQLNRLRRILKHQNLRCITFGRYTGETEHERDSLSLGGEQLAEFNDAWNRLPQYDVGIAEEGSLANEYLDRARWATGGADILITNHVMLERLMLVPGNHFFDECWDFIVLDEAHSYTGSTGTEIAWLMRRLERRLRNEKHGPIQFLATSATLSSNPDLEVQTQAADEFARKIFPLSGRPLHVEFGQKSESLDKTGAIALPITHLADFFREHQELYKETIALELRKVRLKTNERNVELIKSIDIEGRLPAKFLYDLSWLFDFPNRKKTDLPQDIQVDNALRFLAKLVLAQSNDKDYWRDFLHDESLPGGTSLQNDLDSENKPNVKGNRLHFLEIWKNIACPDESPSAIDFETFYYLYMAANEIVQNSDDLDYPIPRLMVKLTSERKAKFDRVLEQNKEEREAVTTEESTLTGKWRNLLPVKDEKVGYETLLYRSLVTHPEIQAYLLATAGKPKAFDELAREIGYGDQDDLRCLLELGALAQNPATRRPLVDVRYHQVIRHITDVGVYFWEGDIKHPVFVRNLEEYGPNGEKVFTLGVCRYCGQPYLLGYARGLVGSDARATRILRAKTLENRYMHAFSWLGEDVELPEDVQRQGHIEPRVFLNLKTGEISIGQKTGPEWLQTKAMLRPRDQAFITQCATCLEEQQSQIGAYGIITPYEASGDYYRLAVLNAFAELSDADPDPQKRGRVPADGRKILVFSDSRPGAARLAYAFEDLVETRLINRMILELVEAYRSFDTPENQKRLQNLQEDVQRYIDNGYGEQAIEGLENEEKALKLRMEEGNSTMDTLLYSQAEEDRAIQIHRSKRRVAIEKNGELYEKLASPEVQYTQLLDYEDENKVLVRDLLAISKFRILQALRNGTRYNLLGKKLLMVRSRHIEQFDGWENVGRQLGVGADIAKEIARRIYDHLIRTVRVDFDMDPTSVESRFAQGSDKLDHWTKRPITLANFRRNWNRNPVFLLAQKVLEENKLTLKRDELSNWLGEGLWPMFKKDFGLLREAFQKEDGRGKTAEYALNFGTLCADMRLRLGSNQDSKDERAVLPLVIQEHTAQIDAKMGAIYQRLFTDGKVNILSCSTTFEMGVDVGGLNNVFLGNLPPASANYRQRAGRAGRRPGAAAFILSLAGESLHDQNYYEHVEELFWGEIQPPEIYLQQPIYAARHFRAEGLHFFFEYLQEQGKIDRSTAGQWQKVSAFILGKSATWKKGESKKRSQLNDTCCEKYLFRWKDDQEGLLDAYLADIDGFSRVDFGKPYSVTEDIVFQLGFSDLPDDETDQEAAYRYYRNLGGCRVPEWDAENRRMKEGRSSKRWGLQKRMEERFKQLAEQIGAASKGTATPAQVHLMNEQTIGILSETCILPRYGFPTDIIELIPAKPEKKTYARGVKMQRRLEQGLFEYAPGQTVPCNKRLFKSLRAAVSAWPGDDGYSASLANEMSENTLYCPVCQKIYGRDEQRAGQGRCPICSGALQPKKYITPEAFFAGRSEKGKLTPQKRGHAIVHWAGQLIGQQDVPGWKIKTGESSDRMLQYVNPGPEGDGFKRGDNDPHGLFYVHEVQTNIAIWQLGAGGALRRYWQNDDRVEKAHLSALYAVRRSIAKRLKIASRDLGVLLKSNFQTGSYDFVFFDKAAGGGGWALALAVQSAEDEPTQNRIRWILEDAIDSLRSCDCRCEIDVPNPSQLAPEEQRRTPVTLPEFKAQRADEQQNCRPTAACYKCLKDYDNQSEQAALDRWDALKVLELQRDGVTIDATEDRWERFDPLSPLIDGWVYLLKNGEEKRYNQVDKNFDAADVDKQEK